MYVCMCVCVFVQLLVMMSGGGKYVEKTNSMEKIIQQPPRTIMITVLFRLHTRTHTHTYTYIYNNAFGFYENFSNISPKKNRKKRSSCSSSTFSIYYTHFSSSTNQKYFSLLSNSIQFQSIRLCCIRSFLFYSFFPFMPVSAMFTDWIQITITPPTTYHKGRDEEMMIKKKKERKKTSVTICLTIYTTLCAYP